MKKELSYYMDYRKVYELFFGMTESTYHDDNLSQSDREKSESTLHTQQLGEAWFNVPYMVIAAGHYEVGDKHYTKRSNLDFFELICTLGGCAVVNVNNQVFECLPNTILLIDCKEKHSFSVKKGATWDYKHIHFVANGMAKNVVKRAMFNMVDDNGTINSLFDDVLKELRHISADSHFLLCNSISGILTEMIRYQFKNSFTDPQEELVERAVNYMHNHYMEKINIKQLATDEFISPYYFIRLFEKYHGVPPYNYLMEYRLKHAQCLFLQQKSVKEVAQECGFSNTNSFSRSFQKRFGISPSQYRDRILFRQVDPTTDFYEQKVIREKDNLNDKL